MSTRSTTATSSCRKSSRAAPPSPPPMTRARFPPPAAAPFLHRATCVMNSWYPASSLSAHCSALSSTSMRPIAGVSSTCIRWNLLLTSCKIRSTFTENSTPLSHGSVIHCKSGDKPLLATLIPSAGTSFSTEMAGRSVTPSATRRGELVKPRVRLVRARNAPLAIGAPLSPATAIRSTGVTKPGANERDSAAVDPLISTFWVAYSPVRVRWTNLCCSLCRRRHKSFACASFRSVTRMILCWRQHVWLAVDMQVDTSHERRR